MLRPARRLLILAVLALATGAMFLLGGSTAATPAQAGADGGPRLAEVLDAKVTSATAADAACLRRRSGAGVVSRTVDLDGPGYVYARLVGAGGDWDLSLFDATGRRMAAGAAPAADEVASGFAFKGGDVTVQACRRSGSGSTARLVLEHAVVEAERSAKDRQVQLVSVSTPTRADKTRLTSLGLDLSEHAGERSIGVVLYGAGDREKLRKAGFTWTVRTPDLLAQDAKDRAADARYAQATKRSALPSGRDTYRTLADYENEMKTLAKENPGLVRLITLPNKTYEGRTVHGLEISTNVNANDGKPAFANLGVHHAREWPAGEHAMEWAYELINGYKAGTPRTKRIVEQSRNLVVPIVNPDGFNTSRTTSGAPAGGENEAVPDTAYIAARPYEYRRKNCRLPDDSQGGTCLTPSVGLAEAGVDPNRNYGALWGGPGADTNPATQSYRGPGPFSEPESRNVQSLVSTRQVMTLITNHTTAGLVLRAPGLASLGDSVDEPIYKALGDAMAAHNGYFSQKSFELYDTTGTTEDWSYNVTGGLGFTFEIYCGDPNYTTGDCDDPAFHPLFATMAKEWDGTNPQADHTNDPGPLKGFDGQGNREAYYIAAESTIDNARHSIIAGQAPEGARLRISKAFKTKTFPQGSELKPIEFDDKLESLLDVKGGTFEWHTNPSTRPIVAKTVGRPPAGPPSPKREDLDATLAEAPVPCPTYFPQTPQAPSGPASCVGDSFSDHPFTFPVGGGVDNDSATLRFDFAPTDDWDLEVYQDRNGNGQVDQADGAPVANSGNGATSAELGFEETTIQRPAATTQYIARMINFAAVTPIGYQGSLTFNPPPPFQQGIKESWTLTCETPQGAVLSSRQIQVDRGQKVDAGRVCPGDTAAILSAARRPGRVCASRSGFRRATVRPVANRRRVRFGFTRLVGRPVTVDVFQSSSGRRIFGERRVARFTGRKAGFTWDGKAQGDGPAVRDGVFFARFRIKGLKRTDFRRLTLVRRNGRFRVRKTFYRPDSCGLLASAKLERAAFGGRTNRPLRVAFRLARRGTVTVRVLRGKRVVRTIRTTNRRARRTHRLRVPSRQLPRGLYRVQIRAVAGKRRGSATLRSQRL